jgi:hypothetical protein
VLQNFLVDIFIALDKFEEVPIPAIRLVNYKNAELGVTIVVLSRPHTEKI